VVLPEIIRQLTLVNYRAVCFRRRVYDITPYVNHTDAFRAREPHFVQRNGLSCNDACPDDRSIARFHHPNINQDGLAASPGRGSDDEDRPGRTT
jgi:hypothetical protein